MEECFANSLVTVQEYCYAFFIGAGMVHSCCNRTACQAPVTVCRTTFYIVLWEHCVAY
jgi:hypothetical protein